MRTSRVSFLTNSMMKLLGVARKQPKKHAEEAFDKYVRENADSYFDDAIANGYFRGDSKSWHDKM